LNNSISQTLILSLTLCIFNVSINGFSIASATDLNSNIGETIVYTINGNHQLTEDIIKNLSFMVYNYLLDDDPTTAIYENKGVSLQKFTNGRLKGENSMERIYKMCFGDINGDSKTDAVTIIPFYAGGANSYNHYLSLIIPEGELYKIYQTELLYFPIIIDSAEIKGKRVFLHISYRGPEDPMCCPTQKGTLGFKLEGDKIIETKKISFSMRNTKYLN
jgi:hypothetical protein